MRCRCRTGTSGGLREETPSSTRARSLFDDDEDDHEQYAEPLIFELTLDQVVTPCGSTASLPALQVDTDRCEEDRMEIPWLQISLPPPGTLQIKGKKTITRKAPCTCWRTREDVLDAEPPTKTVQVPAEICKSVGTNEENADETETGGVEAGEDAKMSRKSETPEGKAPEKRQSVAADSTDKTGTEGEEFLGSINLANAVSKDEPAPVEFQLFVPAKAKHAEEEQGKEEGKIACPCATEEDECKDIKALRMLYDDPCYASHEPYMDPLYHLFPDDCDTPCGPYTEIPWDQLLIPKNIKLKAATRRNKRRDRPESADAATCNCDPGDPSDPNTRSLVRADKNEMVRADGELTFEDFMMLIAGQASSQAKVQPQDAARSQTCACFEMGEKRAKPPAQEKKSSTVSCRKRHPKTPKRCAKQSKKQEIMDALDNCQREMLPIRSALTDLKAKVKRLRRSHNREMEDTKGPCRCGGSAHSSLAPPPMSIPMPGPPFLPLPPLPLPGILSPLPTELPFVPSFPGSAGPTSQLPQPPSRVCRKCKRKKPAKKESNNASGASDQDSRRRRAPGSHAKDRHGKHKLCRCSKKMGAKKTNTRRVECKGSKSSRPTAVPSPANERPQSARSSAASEGKLIIEECCDT